MQRKHEMIPSERMGRHVHLWRYGHFGMPILVFPSAAGMAHEWEAHGMIEALAPMIEGGKIKLYCTESNVAEAWTREDGDPAWRIGRHMAYERYVVDELVPFIRDDCRHDGIRVAVTGVSMGAYYASNVALKYPETFNYALCLSGRYDMTWLTHGFSNEDIYFNNPMAYLPNMDGEMLERVRSNTHLTLVCGRGRFEGGNTEATEALAGLLQAKQIPHECDLWGRDSSHEWPWWRRQVLYHLGRRFG